MRSAIAIENAGPDFSAHVPDLPGCVATGATVDEARCEIREANAFHLEGLREDRAPIAPPSRVVRDVDIAARSGAWPGGREHDCYAVRRWPRAGWLMRWASTPRKLGPHRAIASLAMVVAAPLFAWTAAAAGACDSGEHRQFDFWLGEWNVRTPDGKLAGVNSISSEYGGCVLHERYSTGRGYAGESLNMFDATRKLWHQTWVDTSGALLLLEGGLRGRSMVLEGQTVGADGQVTRHRITWTPNADGSVRQHWESTDAKGQWRTAFDGSYTKK